MSLDPLATEIELPLETTPDQADFIVVPEDNADDVLAERLARTLTQVQRTRLKHAAMELARKAAHQHRGQVEWAMDALRNHLESFGSNTSAEHNLRPVLRLEEIGRDKMAHIASIAKTDHDGSILSHHMEISITTDVRCEESASGTSVGYVTRTRSVIDGILMDVQNPQVVGAVVT